MNDNDLMSSLYPFVLEVTWKCGDVSVHRYTTEKDAVMHREWLRSDPEFAKAELHNFTENDHESK